MVWWDNSSEDWNLSVFGACLAQVYHLMQTKEEEQLEAPEWMTYLLKNLEVCDLAWLAFSSKFLQWRTSTSNLLIILFQVITHILHNFSRFSWLHLEHVAQKEGAYMGDKWIIENGSKEVRRVQPSLRFLGGPPLRTLGLKKEYYIVDHCSTPFFTSCLLQND